MNSYFVTGASGFLGRFISKELEQCRVISIGKSTSNNIQADITKTIPFHPIEVETVIHIAGKAHSVPKNEDDKNEFYLVNHEGTRNLIDFLEKQVSLPRSFVFISTIAVYGTDEGFDIRETHPLKGCSPYADSKILAEEALKEWCQRKNIKLTILRLPLIVGNNAPGNLGSMMKMMKRGFYIGIGDGSARKSMVLASDVARFIPIVKDIGGIYNLTDGIHPTVAAFESALANRIGIKKVRRLPKSLVKIMAKVGDLLGDKSPFNSYKFEKLTKSLTFNDDLARSKGWKSKSVLEYPLD
jgi:nucleoside-diphosphate-sugar epimerase